MSPGDVGVILLPLPLFHLLLRPAVFFAVVLSPAQGSRGFESLLVVIGQQICHAQLAGSQLADKGVAAEDIAVEDFAEGYASD